MKWAVYKQFVRDFGGPKAFGFVVFFYVVVESLRYAPLSCSCTSASATWWLSQWSADAFSLAVGYYISVYALLSIGQSCIAISRDTANLPS